MEKIYLNSIPVYRTEQDDGFIKYVLFENDEMFSVINVAAQKLRIDEYKIVLEFIADQAGFKNGFLYGINVRIEKI